MDYDKKFSDKKFSSSVLQGDDFFFNRVISRNSSVGCSSRIFYYRSSEGVPFNWEMQPGTPKNPQNNDVLPPITPPPAVLSSAFPKPYFDIEEPGKISVRSKLKFWKFVKKIHGRKRIVIRKNCDEAEICSSSDGEFVASPARNSSFSSSSTVSFGGGNYSRQLSLGDSLQDHHQSYGCSPWSFNSVLVRISRRV